MKRHLDILNPLDHPGWDDLVRAHRDCSFFHTAHWARVLHESYAYRPLYFTRIENGALKALVPVLEIDSFLTGKRGVSLPFTDYCNPILSPGESFREVVSELIDYGKKAHWQSLEIRSEDNVLPDSPPSITYSEHILDLKRTYEDIILNFRDSTNRNAKKSAREGVQAKRCTTLNDVKEFYRLNCLTRKGHGLPPQPYCFFEHMYEHIIAQGMGSIFLADYQGKTIAGAVYFHFGRKALFKYGASDRRYQHLRANNLVMQQAILWYAKNGYESMSFGRTGLDHKGLLQFKGGWGATERIIRYYKYDFAQQSFTTDIQAGVPFYSKVLKKMPIPLLKGIGSIFYEHMG